MQGHAIVNVTDLTEDPRLGGFRIRIVALCALVALLDGLDVQIVGVTAPAMAATLNISAPALGVALSATLLGLMIGAITLGTDSDRIGRKPILVMATAAFGALTIATGLVQSRDQFIAVRFLAGVGLGGAMPSFAALASDYAPRSKRALLARCSGPVFRLAAWLAKARASVSSTSHATQTSVSPRSTATFRGATN